LNPVERAEKRRKNKIHDIQQKIDICKTINTDPLSLPLFQPSTIFNANQPSIDPNVRLSKKAQPPRTHHVRCIEARARSFQGFRPYTFVEKLWTQLYDAGGHYTHHYDWASASPSAGRISSFMVYLDANCTGGGTNFPRLERPRESEWCKWIECPAEAGREQGGIGGAGDGADESRDDEKQVMDGVTWKPIRGNAVYWENFDMDGRGYEESWHAGMPVTSGTKIGLNIWSWYQKGYRPPPPLPEETDPRQGS
jgi:prolyl 4-hydroxylase